jgi:hypothetical protein
MSFNDRIFVLNLFRSRVYPRVSESTVSILGRQSNEASDIPLESRDQADNVTVTTDAAQY